MSTIKKISGDYTLETLNPGDKINIRSTQVIINGDLVVSGQQTSVESTNTKVTDNVLTLNAGETNNGISLGTAGIEIDRGNFANVEIRFNEDPEGNGSVSPSWQATEDGTTWKYLLQGSTPGGLSNVSDDTNPALGGNLNITGHTIYDTDAQVVVYADTVAGGGSGVYSAEIDGSNPQELVTKSKALAFSIIFG